MSIILLIVKISNTYLLTIIKLSNLICEGFILSKFTYKEKQLAVKLYLQGVSSNKIIKELNIASRSQLLFWVKQFQEHGELALKQKRNHREYDLDFKFEVLDWKAKNNASYEATALHFGIPTSSIIYRWQKADNDGTLANPKRRGRPKKSLQSMTVEEREIKSLREQNQALLAELVKLKKEKAETMMLAN